MLVLRVLIAGGFICPVHGQASNPIVDVRFDAPYQQIAGSSGDKWAPTWGQGSLYTPSGDVPGFGSVTGNVVFGRLVGSKSDILEASAIEALSDYRDAARADLRGASWRAAGSYAVDGALYLFIACRIHLMFRCGFNVNDTDLMFKSIMFANSSVIRSTDGGRAWARSEPDNFNSPMFPGFRFGAPYFVWYGEEGKSYVDNGKHFVYAISNNGRFSNGDGYTLGRVRRDNISRLKAADWSYYKEGDGMKDRSWTAKIEDATSVLFNPGRSSMTGATYIEGLRRYVLVAWSKLPGK